MPFDKGRDVGDWEMGRCITHDKEHAWKLYNDKGLGMNRLRFMVNEQLLEAAKSRCRSAIGIAAGRAS